MKVKFPKIDVKKGFGALRAVASNNAPELCAGVALLLFGVAVFGTVKATKKCQADMDAAILEKNVEFFKTQAQMAEQAASQNTDDNDDYDEPDYDEPDYGDEPIIDIMEDEYSDAKNDYAKNEAKEIKIPAEYNTLTRKEKAVIYAKNYWLILLLMLLGGTGVVSALKLKDKKLKAAMVAAAMAETALANRENAITSILTPRQLRDVDIAENRALLEKSEEPDESIIERSVIVGHTLFYDPLFRRYFYSDIEGIRGAINDAREQQHDMGGITLNDFYIHLGIKTVENGDDIGWDMTRNGGLKCELKYDEDVNHKHTVVLRYSVTPEVLTTSRVRGF